MSVKLNKSVYLKKLLFITMFPAMFLLLSGCGAGGGARDTHFIIAGSTSVQPYVEMLAEEFALISPDLMIDVQGGGSSGGIQAAESHAADIGMSSRDLRGDELNLWSKVITKDGLAIIIHPENPVDSLTIEEIRGIYSGYYTNWSQVGGKDARIHVIAREEGSGTRGAFEEMVMDGQRISPRSIVQNANGSVRQLVADDPLSIGFISLGLVDVGERPVKALHINGVEPSRENVINHTYTLFRSFLFVATEEPTGDIVQFIDFIMSEKGQALLSAEGLIPPDA